MSARSLLVVLALIVAPSIAVAQEEGTPTCPDSAVTQFDMHVCANQAYMQSRTLLDGLLREVQAALEPPPGEPDRRALLDSAQIAWFGYAQVQCGFEASAYDGGTMLPMIQLYCLAAHTNARILELAPELCQAAPDGICSEATRYREAVNRAE